MKTLKEKENPKKKTSIEDVINNSLKGKIKDNAINFLKFLKENKLSPQWSAINSYAFRTKKKTICLVNINNGEWLLRLYTQYDDELNTCFIDEKEEIRQVIMDRLVYCSGCGCTCAPGVNANILGKQVNHACYYPIIKITNPNLLEMECSKKLVVLRKTIIINGRDRSLTYIPIDKRKKLALKGQ